MLGVMEGAQESLGDLSYFFKLRAGGVWCVCPS